MDWSLWLLDKLGLLVVMIIAMKLGIRYTRAFIYEMLEDKKKITNALIPNITPKQGFGLMLAHAAEPVGKGIGQWVQNKLGGKDKYG